MPGAHAPLIDRRRGRIHRRLREFRKSLFYALFHISDRTCYWLFGIEYRIRINKTWVVKEKVLPPGRANKEPPEEITKKKTDILGIPISPWSLASFSLFHLLAFSVSVYLDFRPSWIKYILEYNLLSLFYIAVAVALYDTGLKRLLISIRNWLEKQYQEYLFNLAFF